MKIIKSTLKSNKGFTMQDLIIACFIITAFIGIITTVMYSAYKTNAKAYLMSQMTMYSVSILEDMDKISYEDVQTKSIEEYRQQFSIPEAFNINIEINNYGQELENAEDVIKVVKLSMSYTFKGETEEFTVKKLKVKEM